MSSSRPLEPTELVRPVWVAGLTLATIGVIAAFFGPIQVLLAQQAEDVAPGNKELMFGIVTGAGAAMSVIANPLFGALSDRTSSRRGRRVPWVAGGALGAAAGLALLAGLGALPVEGLRVVPLMVLGWQRRPRRTGRPARLPPRLVRPVVLDRPASVPGLRLGLADPVRRTALELDRHALPVLLPVRRSGVRRPGGRRTRPARHLQRVRGGPTGPGVARSSRSSPRCCRTPPTAARTSA